jgi:hypothetical protein
MCPNIYVTKCKSLCNACTYASSTTICNVNDLWYILFYAKRGDVESMQLLPCKDCLYMHVLCDNYQAAMWRLCLEMQHVALDPKTCRWMMDEEGNRTIEWKRRWITSSRCCVAIVFMQMCPGLHTSRLCVPGERTRANCSLIARPAQTRGKKIKLMKVMKKQYLMIQTDRY